MPDETTLLADECAAEASAWLATVAEIASGAAPESAIPLLLLTTSQIQLVGARLGAINDVVLEQRFEDDAGPDTDLDPLRTGLAQLLCEVDEYGDVADPVTSPEPTAGSLSNDLAIIAGALTHGLAHHEAGRTTEALWWWQYSYLADWGDRAAMAVRVLQTLLGHLRLDADDDVVGEAEFDALHS
ncbi:DUF5063 domain-containing protein [Janibacter alittae]|uniref:DUF5063 domain-containing protein n=1 Tax=Janibacter alittae TaxID=3115209 RepID=A0ABZ2MFU0_9MICO